jgi:3-deoxy-D-manno-octulosonic-acid transferase
MSRALYTLLFYLLTPFIPLRLLWRGVRQPEYLNFWAERFGLYPDINREKPLIWLHCVSVGETRAAEPLVHELQKRYPQHQILITHATPTGRATSEQLFGDTVQRAYLPYDLPGAVSRFLDHYKPQLGLLLETELWFNLIAGCKRRRIPLLLVNARLSERSAQGYARIAGLTREGLQSLTAIAAQTAADAERLQTLGAENVEICGNLKFDVKPPADAGEQGTKLRAKFGEARPVFLAASTRDGEEVLILDAVAGLDIPNLLTVIVPRHPQRFDEVAALLDKRAIKYVRRSGLKRAAIKPDVSVVLGDSMGEMFTYYAACDAAFIGGSLLPFGGQNLLEACTMGAPVIIGPHTFNFSEIAEQAVEKGAALRVSDVSELGKTVEKLFSDSALRKKMGVAAGKFSSSAGGATTKIANMAKRYFST